MSNEKKGLALKKINFILMGIAVVLIVVGLALMSGATTIDKFNPEIFSPRRITVAPIVALSGFALMIAGIIWKPKNENEEDEK